MSDPVASGPDNLARFARLSAEAQIRGAGLFESVVRDEDGQPASCMTGDGNRAIRGRLCRECVTRPYGTRGPACDKECTVCWAPQTVWVGNAWAIDHLPPHTGPLECSHECHADEVWLA